MRKVVLVDRGCIMEQFFWVFRVDYSPFTLKTSFGPEQAYASFLPTSVPNIVDSSCAEASQALEDCRQSTNQDSRQV